MKMYSGDVPWSGWIHTLPATSSLDVVGNALMYAFSAASSSADAQGKAALNMPVALTKPSFDRLCKLLSTTRP